MSEAWHCVSGPRHPRTLSPRLQRCCDATLRPRSCHGVPDDRHPLPVDPRAVKRYLTERLVIGRRLPIIWAICFAATNDIFSMRAATVWLCCSGAGGGGNKTPCACHILALTHSCDGRRVRHAVVSGSAGTQIFIQPDVLIDAAAQAEHFVGLPACGLSIRAMQ